MVFFRPFFKKCRNYLEYFPLILITLLFVAETEMNNRLISTTWNIALMLIVIIILYLFLIILKVKKAVAFLVCILLWIVLIYVKRCKLPQSI